MPYDINVNLNEKELKDLEAMTQLQLLAQNPNLVNCSCGNVMEVVPGTLDLNQKDENGQPIKK